MRILIVDDNPKMRELIRSLMSPRTNEILECTDGAAARAAYRSFSPDWVLMDLDMPVLDGISATHQIIAFDPAARIVVVTNHDSAEIRIEVLNAGAIGFVAKDNLIELRRIVRDNVDK